MKTKNKIKSMTGILTVGIWLSFAAVSFVGAGSLSSSLSTFTLSEDRGAASHETRFGLTLTPELVDQVTTAFTTNGQYFT